MLWLIPVSRVEHNNTCRPYRTNYLTHTFISAGFKPVANTLHPDGILWDGKHILPGSKTLHPDGIKWGISQHLKQVDILYRIRYYASSGIAHIHRGQTIGDDALAGFLYNSSLHPTHYAKQ